jgi:sigma-B regulation protein RsbU (phosphoserine phosphatase)
MRSSRGWLTLALFLEATVAAADAVLPGGSLTPLLLVGPQLAALRLDATRTAGAAVLAVALAMVSMLEAGPAGSADAVPHGVVVLVGGLLAVLIARDRTTEGRALARLTRIAEVAHRAILHPIPSVIGGMRFAAHYQSASDGAPIGGDFYATVPARSGLRLIVGDVKGKGLEGVRLAAGTLARFREIAATDMDLVRLAGELDRGIRGELGPEDFVTLILAEFRPGEVSMVNCGHHPPLRVGHRLDLLYPPHSSPPLGLDPEPVPYRARLAPNERLLFYTDGLLEARDQSGEMFPLDERVRLALTETTLSEALAKLLGRVFEHTSGALSDDLVLVLSEPCFERAVHTSGAAPAGPATPAAVRRARGGGPVAAVWPACWWRHLSTRHWWPR